MNNNDMNIAIRFAVAGGQVVVKEINGMTQSTNTATKSLKQLDSAGSESAKGLTKAASGSKQLANNLSDTQSRSAELRNELATLIGATAGIYAAFETFNGVKAIANIAADFNGLQQRLQTATRETRDYNQVSAEIFAISQKNGVALESSVELFQRMATSRKDLKATNSAMLELNDAVQMLGVLGDASTQALDAGLMQFSQGLSAGVFRAEEWNSLLENIPDVAARIGRGMDDIGKSTKELGFGEMRKLVNEGKLLSQDVLQSILVQLPEIRAEFDKLPVSMSRASVMFDNSFAAAMSQLDSTVGLTNAWAQSLVGASQVLDSMRKGSVDSLSPKLQASIKTAELLAYVVGTVAVAALFKYAKAQTAVLIDTLLANTATTKQVSALGLVTTTTGAATVASNALAMAQRALLGPIGLVLGVTSILTASWFAYEHAAENAKKQNEELATSFERMSNNRKAGLYQESIAELQQVSEKIAQIETKLKDVKSKSIPNNGFGVGNVGASTAVASFPELGELKKRQAELNAVIEEINKNFNAGLPALDAYSDKLTDNTASTTTLADEMLKLYNSQMLSAQAVDSQGRALTGIDLELFKAQFIEATVLPANAAAAIKKFALDAKTATANVNVDTYLNQLKEELKLLDLRLSKGQQTADMQKKLLQFAGANPSALAALQRELQLIEKKQALVTDKETLDSLKKETSLLQIRLAKGEKEYEVQKALYQLKGGDPAVIAQIENQIRAQQKLKEQIALTEQISSGAFDKMLDDMTSMNGMANNIGDVLVQAFGSVAQQLEVMNAGQSDYNDKVKELAIEKAKLNSLDKHSAAFTKGKVAVEENEAKIKANYFQSQMGHFASLTGAASKMFSEQSKGRQVLHKLEVTFAAIETALALKKAAANALTAISNQGSGDPYSAFARVAAMAAIMAGLGIFSGSAGGGISAQDRQRTQSTGTVLGDSSAKSESIANALGRIADLELDQYAELRAINSSIRELSAGIKNLAVNLVASYGRFNESNYPGELGKEYNLQLGSGLASMVGGGVIGLVADKLLGGLVGGLTNNLLGGLFGSKKTELVDSGLSFAAQALGDIIATGLMNATVYDVVKTTKKKLFGLSKSTSERTDYREIDNALRSEFARIFAHMGESVTEAVSLLGLETNKTLESFVINLPALSFKDLKGDEIEKELQAMFSQQGDLMVQYLVPGIAEFQKVGEGLYDTLIRVAQEQAVFNSALDNLGLQLSRFSGVTKAIELEVAQSIIELMGGIEQFQSATSAYFDEFYTKSEQQEALAKMLAAQFAALGITMPTTRDGLKSVIDGLDLTTDAGQKMFAALMGLVDGLDQFYDAAEAAQKAAEEAARAERELAQKRDEYNRDTLRQLSSFGQTPLGKDIADLQRWFDDATKDASALGADTALLKVLYGKKREALAEQYVTKAIDTAKTAMSRLVDDYQRTVNQLGQTLSSVLTSITHLADGIRGDVLNIQKSLPEWNGVSYYQGEVNSLSGQLGSGTATTQLDIMSRLKSAILERYAAEIDGIERASAAAQAQHDAAVAAYDAQLEHIKSLNDAAKSLKDAAKSMLYSDLSPLTSSARIAELQRQFDTALVGARGGDVNAYGSVQTLGTELLKLQQAFDPANYSNAFNSIVGVFNELGSKTWAEPTAPAPHPAMAAYEAEKIALARKTISELQSLTSRTESLSAVANAEYTAAVNALKAQFTVDSAAIAATFKSELNAIQALLPAEFDAVTAKLQEQINAIYAMRDGIVGAINAKPDPVSPTPINLQPILERIDSLPKGFEPIFIPITKPWPEISAQLIDLNKQFASSSAVQIAQLTKISQLELSVPPVINTDFSSVVAQLKQQTEILASSATSLNRIEQSSDMSKPVIVPPPVVNVNVEMSPVVSELRAMQTQQQQQLDQQASNANTTNQRLSEIISANKRLQQELAEFASQVISLARVS